jgi:hypothetical protein
MSWKCYSFPAAEVRPAERRLSLLLGSAPFPRVRSARIGGTEITKRRHGSSNSRNAWSRKRLSVGCCSRCTPAVHKLRTFTELDPETVEVLSL